MSIFPPEIHPDRGDLNNKRYLQGLKFEKATVLVVNLVTRLHVTVVVVDAFVRGGEGHDAIERPPERVRDSTSSKRTAERPPSETSSASVDVGLLSVICVRRGSIVRLPALAVTSRRIAGATVSSSGNGGPPHPRDMPTCAVGPRCPTT